MGTLKLCNIQKKFDKVHVLKKIDIEVADGEFIIFVGPSGCGKSTLLRIIAGLEDATCGDVEIDGNVVNNSPPSERGIAMVFQTYALYPHLSVRKNMSLGLQQAKVPTEHITDRVETASRMLSLDEYLNRRPAQLSGGQRQRVAIGRAIVRQPKLFLFDEPLSNLDATLRVNTRLEIAKLHRRLGATMVYVTHDQVEAMTLADRIVVLNGGIVEQIGSPMELYKQPCNRFVASFIGSPQMNFIDGSLVNFTSHCVGIRPEHITLEESLGDIVGTVLHIEHLGNQTNVYMDCNQAGVITVQLFGDNQLRIGQTHHLHFAHDKILLFDSDGNRIDENNARAHKP